MLPEKVADHSWYSFFLLFSSGSEKVLETQVSPGTRFTTNRDRSLFGLLVSASEMEHDVTTHLLAACLEHTSS
jgi:hypothetical protein